MDDTRRAKITLALTILRSKLHSVQTTTDYPNIRTEASSHLSRIDNFLLHISTSISLPNTVDTCWKDVDAALEALTWMVQGGEGDEWIAEQMRVMREEREQIREQMIKEVKSHHNKFLRYIRGREQGRILAAQSANGNGNGNVNGNGGGHVNASASLASTKRARKHMAGVSDDKNHGPLWKQMWSGIRLMGEAEDALQNVEWEELDKVKDEYKADVGDLIMETEMSLLRG